MNRMYNRLNGFTLMEQIVVLALTSLLTLIGYTAIMNFQQLTRKIRNNAEQDRTIYLLSTTLENDFKNSESVNWNEGLEFHGLSEPVGYTFEKQSVLRKSSASVDTFRLVISDIAWTKLSAQSDLINAFSFVINSESEAYRFSFFKEYPEYKLWEINEYGN